MLTSRRGREGQGDERGVTLIELLISMALLSVVVGVMFGALWEAQKSEAYSRGRTEALDDMRLTMNRMNKDLRQVTGVNGVPTTSHLDVNTYIDGAAANVVYEVVGDTLTRQVDSGAVQPVQTGLTSVDIFSYTPDPATANMVSILLSVAPANTPETELQLNSEIQFRNG